MEEIKLNDDVIDQIKNFNNYNLTKEQELLIDKLILNKDLRKCYMENGLCKKCNQPKNNYYWCQFCHFQQNFKNWTSGNHDIDEFIQKTQLKAKNLKQVIEWIEYDRFENIEYLAKGGFGTTYKADWNDGHIINGWDSENNQWERKRSAKVVLKCLHNLQDITIEFLREIESHIKVNGSKHVVKCYGITKNSETNDFIMVMAYAENGSLRQYLNNRFNLLDWGDKLHNLHSIAEGLRSIHDNKLIHHDFHCGNILSYSDCDSTITDLGLCQPANVKPSQSDNKKIYGVLPYVDPEVLRGKEYIQASDVYGFGIIAYEVCTGLPPYNDIAHDEFLAMRICQGLRPKSNYKIPQLILDIIEQCWDADPLKRPNADELTKLFENLINSIYRYHNSETIINKQIKEANEINRKLSPLTPSTASSTSALSYTTHSQAIYISRLLDFKNLKTKPKNAINDSPFETEYPESIRIDFTKLNINP